jgi:DNA-binding NtrC family response regulator
VPLNVGALSESLADGELFGHRRGAFTGAVAARAGAFEEAQKGTLFLDEIAELTPALQVKLLRVVEDGVVRPLGASQPLSVDVRLVSASWARLTDRVADGRFRADLYHRLAMVQIRLPPLRQRKSDIPALADALLKRFERDVGPKRLSSAALAALVQYAWPGNVRELGSALYRAAVASDGARIELGHLDLPTLDRSSEPARTLSASEVMALFERHRSNATAAARAARVPRSTFRSWLDKARAARVA